MSSSGSSGILGRLERSGIKLGLETTRSLLGWLGEPQRRYPTVLVGGTNGKGSTATLLASMASAAGYRTGLFTSPHLETPRERLRVDGTAVSEEELSRLLSEVVSLGERRLGHPPSYFEALCVAALKWFAERELDLAVLEVGLGGRLDATNVCDPALSIVTNIALDHQEILGRSEAEIAGEKAGIARLGRPLLTAARGAGLEALRQRAEELGAPIVEPVADGAFVAVEEGLRGQIFDIQSATASYRIELSLAGRHQRVNAGLAVAAAECLSKAGFERLDETAIEAGAAAARWPGRLELVESKEGDGRSVLLDAAHNRQGAEILAEFLARNYPAPTLLFGALKKKAAPSMLGSLAAGARKVVLTRPESHRAVDPATLREVAEQAVAGRDDDVPVEVEKESAAALDRALAGSGRVVVCGSLYLVGEIRKRLRAKWGVPPPAA